MQSEVAPELSESFSEPPPAEEEAVEDDAAPPPAAAEKRKKRVVSVVRKKEASRPLSGNEKRTKTVLVSRLARPDEEIDRTGLQNVSSPLELLGLRRDAEGSLMERSVLGGAGLLESQLIGDEQHSSTGSLRNLSKGGSYRELRPELAGIDESSMELKTSDGVSKYRELLEAARDQAKIAAREESAERSAELDAMPEAEGRAADREARCLRQWIEQQKDWRRLGRGLGAKAGKQPGELVMETSGGNYRAQTEIYEVMQAAIPDHVRHAEHYWEMSLRFNSQRLVPVGNIFSGLFCPVESHKAPPAVYRQPNPSGSVSLPKIESTRSWKQDPYLKKRQRQWKFDELMPHIVEEEHTQGLIIVSQNLFDWALYSTDLCQKKLMEEEILKLEEPQIVIKKKRKKKKTQVMASALEFEGSPHLTMSLEVAPNKKLPMVPQVARSKMTNTGESVVYYEWRKRQNGPSPALDEEAIEGVYTALEDDVMFFCETTKGALLPGESTQICFGFASRTAGEFTEEWKLSVVPKATQITGLYDKFHDNAEKDVGVVLHGLAMPEPPQRHVIAHINAQIQKGVDKQMCLDLLYDEVIAHVFDPSPEAIEAGRVADQKSAFERNYSASRALLYTEDRFKCFACLYDKAQIVKREIMLLPPPIVVEEVIEEEEEEPTTAIDRAALACRLAKKQKVSTGWDADVETLRLLIDSIVIPQAEVQEARAPPLEEEDEEEEEEEEEVEVVADPRVARVDGLRVEFAAALCEASVQPPPTAPVVESLDPLTDLLAIGLTAAEGEAKCEAAVGDEAAWTAALEATFDGIEESESIATYARGCVGGLVGLESYRAAAVATSRKVLNDLCKGGAAAAADVQQEADDRGSEALLRLAQARSTDVQGKVVLYQASSSKEDVAYGLESLAAKGPPSAIVLLTDYFEESTATLMEGLQLALVEEAGREIEDEDEVKPPPLCDLSFVGSLAELKEALLLPSERIRVLVLESRTRQTELCSPIADVILEEDEFAGYVLPHWDDHDALVATETAEAAVKAYDAGFRLRGLVDLVAHDDLEILNPSPLKASRIDDDAARTLTLLEAPRVLGPIARAHVVAAAKFLERKGNVLAVIGDEVDSQGMCRAALLESLIDRCDEICIGGQLGFECLAASGVQIGSKCKKFAGEGVLAVARRLLAKARAKGVIVRLPCDLVGGDVYVDSKGEREDGIVVIDEEEEPKDEDDEPGFEYVGEIAECGLAQGVPAFYPMDVGPATAEVFKESIAKATTVLWTGVMGNAECTSFQSGTREVAEALVAAETVTICCGAATTRWLHLFCSSGKSMGNGEGVSHVCATQVFERLLCGDNRLTGILGNERDPQPAERLLIAEQRTIDRLAAERAAELAEEEEEEDDDDEDDY